MVFKANGKLNFFPENRTKKHSSQAVWKCHALIETECDLEHYYAWFLETRFNLKLNKTIRGTHISFIADRYDPTQWDEVAQTFHGNEITFYYEIEPRSNGEHWWLRVHSPEAIAIREAIGLTPEPFHAFHLSLGYANDKNLFHSKYILDVCKRYELISSEPRKPFTMHTIYEHQK